ncbi:M20/M25/M40 family metallo-hydrolase [Micromonospora sp. LOL_024]|uniref:M20/M25/M40 family metallo-hydrolase n=1 Tax=Micromonospora sp. LOL_024 TaxID=3345412 RepID=UPI003A8ACDDA
MTTGADGAAKTYQDEATEVLRTLIRHRCVNDGTTGSGGEIASAAFLAEYLTGAGLDLEIVEPCPGRGSLIATLPGRDGPPGGLVLMGHTDVVPADGAGWSVPPFDGALIDGVVWGRGAVDMLGMTATMAVALRHLGSTGFRPAADVTLLAVADEEAGGHHGAGWLAVNRPELFRGRSVVTESGGFPLRTGVGVRLECFVGEKGALGARVVVAGHSAHAAFPYGTENPLYRLGPVLERLREHRPAPVVDDVWLAYVDGMDLPEAWSRALSNPHTFDQALAAVPLGLARHFHAVTRTTVTPTIVRGGAKRNVVPGRVEIDLDVRVAPGQSEAEVRAVISGLFDGLDGVRVEFAGWRPGSASDRRAPLWMALERVTAELLPGAVMVPAISAATTDGRHVRPLDVPCYGYGLFSERIPATEFFRMFHSTDERIDQDSLVLLCQLWEGLARYGLIGAAPTA